MNVIPIMFLLEIEHEHVRNMERGAMQNHHANVCFIYFLILYSGCCYYYLLFDLYDLVINCGIPKRSTGIRYTGSSFTINSVLMFECEPGYKLVEGSGRRVCQENGRWSGGDISCKCKCNFQFISMMSSVFSHSNSRLGFTVIDVDN